MNVMPDYMVHAGRQPVQRDPPSVDKGQGQQPAVRLDLPDALAVVVDKAVASRVQQAQLLTPSWRPAGVPLLQLDPEVHVEQFEVGPKCVGIGVPPVEPPA